MIKVRSNAIQILNENRDKDQSIEDLHWLSKENDPGYMRWLFNDDNLGDYSNGMTSEHFEVLAEFEKYEL